MQILICGDEKFYRELIQPFDTGECNFQLFTDSEQVSQYLCRGDPAQLAVVAFDGTEGRIVCQKLRECCPEMSLIWLSDQKEFEAEGRQIPVADFFVKPSPVKWLRRAIENQMRDA